MIKRILQSESIFKKLFKHIQFIVPLLLINLSVNSQSIDDFKMLVGTWQGSGFNSELTEVWAAPSSGTMMGMFKMEKDGEVIIYEFMDLAKENGTFRMTVKHFNADMTGWEEKNDYEAFPLLDVKENKLVFEGLTIKKPDNNTLIYLLTVDSKDGSERIEEIIYTRVK